tara:strand:+ start:19 stop:657 length:639 start_codon:yes stop_codon:yes gene_type:complete
MSTLNVDKVDPSTGTALEIGSSGDTITVPSGATFAVSGTMNASSITAGTLAIARGGTGAATLAAAGLANTPMFFAHSSTGQAVTSATWTKVTLGTELIDTDSAFASDTFTVPSGKDGKYMFQGSLNTFADNDMTRAQVAIYKNDAVLAVTYNFITSTDQDVRHCTADITTIDDASAGDYYDIYGYITGSTPQFSHDHVTPRSTNFLGYKLIG